MYPNCGETHKASFPLQLPNHEVASFVKLLFLTRRGLGRIPESVSCTRCSEPPWAKPAWAAFASILSERRRSGALIIEGSVLALHWLEPFVHRHWLSGCPPKRVAERTLACFGSSGLRSGKASLTSSWQSCGQPGGSFPCAFPEGAEVQGQRKPQSMYATQMLAPRDQAGRTLASLISDLGMTTRHRS